MLYMKEFNRKSINNLGLKGRGVRWISYVRTEGGLSNCVTCAYKGEGRGRKFHFFVRTY